LNLSAASLRVLTSRPPFSLLDTVSHKETLHSAFRSISTSTRGARGIYACGDRDHRNPPAGGSSLVVEAGSSEASAEEQLTGINFSFDRFGDSLRIDVSSLDFSNGYGLGGARRAFFLVPEGIPFPILFSEKLVAPLLVPELPGVQAPVNHPVEVRVLPERINKVVAVPQHTFKRLLDPLI